MGARRRLEWGETPWDELPRDQLLREVQRMYMAVGAAWSVMRLVNDGSPFWGRDGSGGRALLMADQIAEPLERDFDQESVYRSFFRYAGGLLFDLPERDRWVVCDACGDMIGNGSHAGRPCREVGPQRDCAGTLRLLEWRDLRRSDEETKES